MRTDESVEKPLRGLKVIEFEAIGPGPLAGYMLGELGADVTVVSRPTTSPVDRALIGENAENPLRLGKKFITLDLKAEEGVIAALDLIADADALIEGNRPGVMERLGVGPADCAVRNPRLVYGRMTGWGQSGPLAQAAGHDPKLHRPDRVTIAVNEIGAGTHCAADRSWRCGRSAGPLLRFGERRTRCPQYRPGACGRCRHRRCCRDARDDRAGHSC